MARLLLRQGLPDLAEAALELAQILAEEGAEPEPEPELPADDDEVERLLQEPPGPILRRTTRGRLARRSTTKLG